MPDLESVLTGFLESLPRETMLGVAHSGGRDSTALAACLVALGAAGRMVCLYADHNDRGAEEMAAEKAFLLDTWRKWGLKGRLLPAPVEKGPEGFEAEARRIRYRVLEGAAREEGLDAVLLAHTRDDQEETLLMRLFRGRSALGLGGIPAHRGLFHRPLLGCRAKQLEDWLKGHGQGWHQDSGNKGRGNLRARMRADLVPVLDRLFPAWRSALETYAQRLSARPSAPWKSLGEGWEMEREAWEALAPWQKADALLSVYRPPGRTVQVSRRSVEGLAVSGKPGSIGGWRLDFAASAVHWAPDVVKGGEFVYFLQVESGSCAILRGRNLRLLQYGPEKKRYAIVPRLGGERWALADPRADWDAVLKAAAPDPRRRRECLFLVAEGRVYGIFGTLSGGDDWVYRGGDGPLWEWE